MNQIYHKKGMYMHYDGTQKKNYLISYGEITKLFFREKKRKREKHTGNKVFFIRTL